MRARIDIHFSHRDKYLFVSGESYKPSENEFLLNHARSAILLALRAIGLPVGSRVGVMVYNCHTVFNAVAQAGYIPVFLDVTEQLKLDFEDLKRKINGLSAIVVTHLFGIVNDVEHIKKEYPDLIIIEDCAHATGIDHLFGDFATFSIGQGKLPSIGDGGLLNVLNDSYLEKARALFNNLPEYTKTQTTRLYLRLCIYSLLHSRFLYGWLTLPMKNRRRFSSGKENIVPMKMCRGISAIYAEEKMGLSEMINLRKSNAQQMMAAFFREKGRPLVGCNGFMLIIHCDDPKALQSEYRKIGIDTDTHFGNCLKWAAEFGYKPGDCPTTEKLVQHLLMVPTYLR